MEQKEMNDMLNQNFALNSQVNETDLDAEMKELE